MIFKLPVFLTSKNRRYCFHSPGDAVESAVHRRLFFFFRHPMHPLILRFSLEPDLPQIVVVVQGPIERYVYCQILNAQSRYCWSKQHGYCKHVHVRRSPTSNPNLVNLIYNV